jgi:LPS-assembly protein
MISRSRFLITAIVVCHLLFAHCLVTSQLRTGPSLLFPSVAGLAPPDVVFHGFEQQPEPPAGAAPAPSTLAPDEVLLQADQQEKQKNIFRARGHVVMHYRNYVMRSDYASYDSNTGVITAIGHVVLDGGPHDEHMEASHGTYNVRTSNGRFYNVTGTTGVRVGGRQVVLTTSDPFAFTGKVVDKVGDDRYIVHHGSVTSCKPPTPNWKFTAPRVTVDVGGNAKIYNGFFRVRGLPVFYFPFADHPVHRLGRQSGFLMPSFGTSSVKGFLLGDAFFWAINRSMDATVGAELYSARGWAQHGEFRAKPSENSFVDLRYFGVTDQQGQKIGKQRVKEGGQDITLNASTPFKTDYRAVLSVEYLSSFPFRLAFNPVFTNAVFSEISDTAFISHTHDGFFYNVAFERLQDFQGNPRPTRFFDYISNVILHVPSFEVASTDHPIGNTPLYWSFDSSAGGLQRRGQYFDATPLVGRFDLHPDVTMPLRLRGWSFEPQFALRDTAYTDSFTGLAGINGDPVNRKAAEVSFALRPPPLQRIFAHTLWGQRFKHVIEPELTYQLVKGVDNFPRILRFDERDVLTDTNQVEYGITHRIYSKPVQCATPPCPAQEVLTWRVAQDYYFDPTFGGAFFPGAENVFTSTLGLTGLGFLTSPHRFSPVISRLRLQAGGKLDIEWDVDYDPKAGRMNASTSFFNYRIGPFFLNGGHSLLKTEQRLLANPCTGVTTPTPLLSICPFSQYRVGGGYGGSLNRRGFNSAAAIAIDARTNAIQYSVFQTTYNFDCCGLTFEVRRFAIGPVRTDNQFRFAFTLANIGTFGNLRRQERLF